MPRRPARTATPPQSGTPARLLEVAARLFHEQGYEATSVATIAREADVLIGSLYHFYPSKEALLLATLQWRLDALRPIVTDPVEAETQDGIERVFGLLARYRLGLELTGCRQGCPVGNLALELSDDHPAVRALIDANFANWIGVVAGWLADARAQLPAHTDVDALAAFVLTVMEGGIMLARARGNPEPFDQAVAQLRTHLATLTALRTVTARRTKRATTRTRSRKP